MKQSLGDSATTPSRAALAKTGLSPAIEKSEPRNLAALAVYQILLRIGWIFKTESIVMPAFLDYIGGTAGLRGCLPMLARFGQSVPPVLFAQRLKLVRRKKWALAATTFGMALPVAVLGGVWFACGGKGGAWLPWVFLILYALFFIVTGMAQLAANTLQGKLIQPTRQGRLMSLSMLVGSPASIFAAWLLLGPWLAAPEQGFGCIFAFTGLLFVMAAACALALDEPADDYRATGAGPLKHFSDVWQIVRDDANFRRLAVVAALFSMVLMLFPHYQALGRERLGLELGDLMWWVIVQNAALGLFSLLAGPIADHRGNRLVLGILIGASAVTPLMATGMAQLDPELGKRLYWLVFVPVGLTPVTIRTLTNYTLEIASPSDHPRYVSTLNVCVAAPIMLFSPLVGLAVGVTSFELVMLASAAVIVLSALLTRRLAEPRHHRPTAVEEFDVPEPLP